MREAKLQPCVQTRGVPPDDPHHPDPLTAGSGILTPVMNEGSLRDGKSLVFQRNGVVFANSRDVATYFGKRHDHVLRDIDKLNGSPNLETFPGSQRQPLRSPVREEGAAIQHVRSFDMTPRRASAC